MSPIESPIAAVLVVAAALGVILWLAAAIISRAGHHHDPYEVGFCEACHCYVPRQHLALRESVGGARSICGDCQKRAS